MVRILSLVSMIAAVSSISTEKSADATKKVSDTKVVAKSEQKGHHFSRLHRMVANTKKAMAKEIQGFATEGAKSSGAVDAQNTYSFPGTERAVGGQDGYVMEVIYEDQNCAGSAYGSFWGLGQCYTDYNNQDDVDGEGDYSYTLACGETSPYVYMWWGQKNCSGDPTYMKPLGIWMENDDDIPFSDDQFYKRQSVTKLNSCKKFSFTDRNPSNDDSTFLQYSYKVHCPRFDDLSFSLPSNTFNVLSYYDYHQDTTCSSKPQSGDFYRDGYCVHDYFCEGYGDKENCHEDRWMNSFTTVWDTSANLPGIKGPLVMSWREVNCWSSASGVEESYRHALATNCSAWLSGNVQHWSHVEGGLSPEPTSQPSTLTPTEKPSAVPTAVPTHGPTPIPTQKPSFRPTQIPTMPPTYASGGHWQYSHAAIVATVVISIVGFVCIFGIVYLIFNAYRAATGYQSNSEVELR